MREKTQEEKDQMLKEAVKQESPDAVSEALKCGADPNMPYMYNIHVLEWVCMLNITRGSEIAEHLIGAGADMNHMNDRNVTLLMHAALTGNVEIIRILIANGVPINARNKSDCTALHYAMRRNNHSDVAQTLIDAGADVNARDQHGQTPLMSGALNENLEAMVVLLQSGADTNIKNKSKQGLTDILKAWPLDKYQQWERIEALYREDSMNRADVCNVPDFSL